MRDSEIHNSMGREDALRGDSRNDAGDDEPNLSSQLPVGVKNYITPDGYRKLQAELEQLWKMFNTFRVHISFNCFGKLTGMAKLPPLIMKPAMPAPSLAGRISA